jgi:hypothetical protein
MLPPVRVTALLQVLDRKDRARIDASSPGTYYYKVPLCLHGEIAKNLSMQGQKSFVK